MTIAPEDITTELDRIVSNQLFKPKRNMCRLLRHLVTETLEGRKDELKGYSIALDVFKQPGDYDADRNPLVRVNAGRLRTLLRLYYLGDGKEDPIRIEVPTGTYVPAFTRNVVAPPKAASLEAETPIATNTIAVAPFRNLSGRADLDYFCVGFSQDLSDALYLFDDFRVIGVNQRGEPEDTICERARDRGIAILVDGNIQALGPNVKISVQMLDTQDGSTLWAKGFALNLEEENAFEIKEQIVETVAGHMGGEFGHINRAVLAGIANRLDETPNEQVALLKMYNYNIRLSLEDMLDLHATTEKFLEQDPNSGLLHAITADKFGTSYALDFPGSEAAYEKLGEHAERAILLNPDHQIVRAVLAFKCFMYRERERFFHLLDENVEAIASSPLRLGTYAMYACHFGDWETGKPLLDRVFANNINVPNWLHGTMSLYHYERREYERAVIEANKMQLPGFYWASVYRCAALAQSGREADARREYEEVLACRPDFETRGQYLLSRYIPKEDTLEHLLEGVVRAGAKIDRA